MVQCDNNYVVARWHSQLSNFDVAKNILLDIPTLSYCYGCRNCSERLPFRAIERGQDYFIVLNFSCGVITKWADYFGLNEFLGGAFFPRNPHFAQRPFYACLRRFSSERLPFRANRNGCRSVPTRTQSLQI